MTSAKLIAFISSSTLELFDDREGVERALFACGLSPFRYESVVGANPSPPQTTYLQAVKDCDIYIGIFWNRYSKATVDEFRMARREQKPCFIYVKTLAQSRELELDALISEISDGSEGLSYRNYENAFELGDAVVKDIISWLIENWRKQESKLKNNQNFRLFRLKDDTSELLTFLRQNDAVELLETEDFPPILYSFRYRVPGIIGLDENANPVIRNEHMITLELHHDYPMSLPFVKIESGLFHPNVWDETRAVCMGYQELPYSLVDIIIKIGKIITYESYCSESFSNGHAAKWAVANPKHLPLSTIKWGENTERNSS